MTSEPQAAETGNYNQYDLVAWILERFLTTITAELGEIKMALKDALDKFDANTAKITEIAGDIAELKTTNEELVMKIEELKAQLPDNELVAQLEALANTQSESLSKIAAEVPEPSPEPEPEA